MTLGLRYDNAMRSQPRSKEYRNFENILRGSLSISKQELDRRVEADNASRAGRPRRGPKPKTFVSGRASRDTN